MQQLEIWIKGQINRDWSDWFDGLEITHTTGGETKLTGCVRDQAELRGILSRLADLGLELILVNTMPDRQFLGTGGDGEPIRKFDKYYPQKSQ